MSENDKEEKDETEEIEPLKSKEKSKSKKGKRIALTVAVSILAVVLIAAIAVVGVVYHYINLIEYIPPEDGTHGTAPPLDQQFETDFIDTEPIGGGSDTGDTGDTDGTGGGAPDTDDPTGGESAETMPPVIDPDDLTINGVNPIDDDGLLNIMIVGQDRRAGQGDQRSDSMMLVSINTETKKVSLISFLRDMYVHIPREGYADNRLNTAYRFGGLTLLKETMRYNFGVSIDGCFECDFFDFIDIINMLGGVEITLTDREAAYLGLEPGTQVLNGENALAYARIRKIDSDFKRTERQRKILMTLFNKFKDAGVIELKNIADEILPKLSTDMSTNDRLNLLLTLLPMVSSLEVKTYAVPFSGAYKDAVIRKMMVLVPDLDKIRDKLANEYLPF